MSYTQFTKERVSAPPKVEQPSPDERRKSARYVPVLDRGHLGWWAGEDFQTAPAQVLNLSLGGAALLICGPPFQGRSVWVSIAGLEWAGWVAAQVVGTAPPEGKGQVVRLAFAEPLSYELFKTAVWGFPGGERSPSDPSVGAAAT
jgi:hypothetical protein